MFRAQARWGGGTLWTENDQSQRRIMVLRHIQRTDLTCPQAEESASKEANYLMLLTKLKEGNVAAIYQLGCLEYLPELLLKKTFCRNFRCRGGMSVKLPRKSTSWLVKK